VTFVVAALVVALAAAGVVMLAAYLFFRRWL
jgi:hypothetical protein